MCTKLYSIVYWSRENPPKKIEQIKSIGQTNESVNIFSPENGIKNATKQTHQNTARRNILMKILQNFIDIKPKIKHIHTQKARKQNNIV